MWNDKNNPKVHELDNSIKIPLKKKLLDNWFYVPDCEFK